MNPSSRSTSSAQNDRLMIEKLGARYPYTGTFTAAAMASRERLLELFDRANVRATFFVLGWVAERFPGLVRDIAARGHEIGSHGFSHRLVYDQTPEQFRDDLRRSREAIAAAVKVPVYGYRAPSFSIIKRSFWALDVLLEEGFIYDASIFPIRHDRYGVPSAPRRFHTVQTNSGTIWECPGSTVRVGGTNLPVAGGGYFRLLPYAWTQWGISRLNAIERKAAIFYTHPWEIDPDQPRLPLSRIHAVRHYANLATTERKLVHLLAQFRFAPLSDVLAAGSSPARLEPSHSPVHAVS